jgi:xylan 1,4-beta-xylosidase
MGSPIAPNVKQYAELQEASKLATLTGAPTTARVEGGVARVPFSLPRQGVSLLVFQWR